MLVSHILSECAKFIRPDILTSDGACQTRLKPPLQVHTPKIKILISVRSFISPHHSFLNISSDALFKFNSFVVYILSPVYCYRMRNSRVERDGDVSVSPLLIRVFEQLLNFCIGQISRSIIWRQNR